MKTGISLRAIAESILTRVRGGAAITDDENFSFEQMYYHINTYRAKLIRERFMKDGYISSYAYQDLGCLQTTCKDVSDCCPGQGLYWGEKVYQVQLPEIIDYGQDNGVSLYHIDKRTPIEIKEQVKSRYKKHARYTPNKPYAFINTDLINIFSVNPIKYVNVICILKDPREANQFCTNTCYDEDTTAYPIDSTIIPTLELLILRDVFGIALSTTTDLKNDAQGFFAMAKPDIPQEQDS